MAFFLSLVCDLPFRRLQSTIVAARVWSETAKPISKMHLTLVVTRFLLNFPCSRQEMAIPQLDCPRWTENKRQLSPLVGWDQKAAQKSRMTDIPVCMLMSQERAKVRRRVAGITFQRYEATYDEQTNLTNSSTLVVRAIFFCGLPSPPPKLWDRHATQVAIQSCMLLKTSQLLVLRAALG
ncbi:hypothetical protein CSKR_112492 [Clonorchis sinensis]|uniref:Uncharacterized protein n=2 Tax=Clonorchis sinensis TaxID=79923 RepID=G7YQB8_CLOSI|nr:hypothetical protein CSKR_112492 [Clonorchis sinensis]GAA55148.1 hypothetical protein CLF_107026 [Clonorchis sinensis]